MNDPPLNPYSPPAAQLGPVNPPPSGYPISARCVHRRWLGRTILLSGQINAEVRYTGWTPGESVYVDNVFVAKCRSLYFTAVAPQIDFTIDSGGNRYAATITAQASYLRLLRLIRFALIVDGNLVYQDSL